MMNKENLNDGFTYKDWYEMPVKLRNYYVTIVNDVSEKRKEEMDNSARR